MYIPKHFAVSNNDEIFSFIEANGFGQLVSNVNGQLFSTHLPFLLAADKQTLVAHLARNNPQVDSLIGQEIMVTLEGPHDYVSPSWYTGPGVPTWNYQAVHIYGHCRLVEDREELKTIVDSLAAKYESGFESPWQPDYSSTMLGAIIGIEIVISDIQCKYKLSQNRSAQERIQVIEQLKKLGSHNLARAMEDNENPNL